MSLKTEVESRTKVTKQVDEWLNDYEMPVNVYSVVSALVSLGYLSERPTTRAADGATLDPCPECEHPRNGMPFCAFCGTPRR